MPTIIIIQAALAPHAICASAHLCCHSHSDAPQQQLSLFDTSPRSNRYTSPITLPLGVITNAIFPDVQCHFGLQQEGRQVKIVGRTMEVDMDEATVSDEDSETKPILRRVIDYPNGALKEIPQLACSSSSSLASMKSDKDTNSRAHTNVYSYKKTHPPELNRSPVSFTVHPPTYLCDCRNKGDHVDSANSAPMLGPPSSLVPVFQQPTTRTLAAGGFSAHSLVENDDINCSQARRPRQRPDIRAAHQQIILPLFQLP